MKLKLQTVENSYVQSLTINGDFQINQRGKSEYRENGYTLDMWSCILANGNKLSQLPSGYGVLINKVKANQTVLRQRNPNVSKYPVGTKFTVVYDFESNVSFSNEVGFGKQRKSIQVEAKRKQYSFIWTLQSNDIDENKNVDVLVFNNTDTNVQLKIYSVDVFEGEIAYKHHREDYATALMRCQSFIVKISNIFSGFTDKTGKFITFLCDKIINMQGTPTLNGAIPLILRIEGSESTPTSTSATVKKESGEIVLTFSSNYSSIASKTISGRMNNDIIIVTSEPM